MDIKFLYQLQYKNIITNLQYIIIELLAFLLLKQKKERLFNKRSFL